MIGNVMYFSNLDRLSHASGIFTLAWRFKDLSMDPWTMRMNSFKSGFPNAIAGACRVVPMALKEVDWTKYGPVAITSAISSKDTVLEQGSGLYTLGESTAKTMQWVWKPGLLTKKAHRSLHRIDNAGERDAEVSGAYTSAGVDGAKTVVIVDDFCTRGATISDAARAIQSKDPGVIVFGFALGKSETSSYAQGQGVPIDNSKVPVQWAERWDGA